MTSEMFCKNNSALKLGITFISILYDIHIWPLHMIICSCNVISRGTPRQI